jgi:hypothetical protein
MEFIHVRKKEIRIFVGSAERELEIRRVIDRHLDAIREIQAVLDRKAGKESDVKPAN